MKEFQEKSVDQLRWEHYKSFNYFNKNGRQVYQFPYQVPISQVSVQPAIQINPMTPRVISHADFLSPYMKAIPPIVPFYRQDMLKHEQFIPEYPGTYVQQKLSHESFQHDVSLFQNELPQMISPSFSLSPGENIPFIPLPIVPYSPSFPIQPPTTTYIPFSQKTSYSPTTMTPFSSTRTTMTPFAPTTMATFSPAPASPLFPTTTTPSFSKFPVETDVQSKSTQLFSGPVSTPSEHVVHTSSSTSDLMAIYNEAKKELANQKPAMPLITDSAYGKLPEVPYPKETQKRAKTYPLESYYPKPIRSLKFNFPRKTLYPEVLAKIEIPLDAKRLKEEEEKLDAKLQREVETVKEFPLDNLLLRDPYEGLPGRNTKIVVTDETRKNLFADKPIALEGQNEMKEEKDKNEKIDKFENEQIGQNQKIETKEQNGQIEVKEEKAQNENNEQNEQIGSNGQFIKKEEKD